MINFKEFLIYEQQLLEDRIDFLKDQFRNKLNTNHDTLAKHHDSDNVVDHFAQNADPSSNKQHTHWILKQYQQGKIRQEDHPRIHTALSNFETHKPKLIRKDLNQYRSLNDLEDSIQPHLGKTSSGKEQKKLDKSGAEKIHDENGFKVYHLKTKEAACHYGKGTKWCTAGDDNNMFDHYNEDGPIYYIEGKNHKGETKKFQFHFHSNQFMDDKDESINLGEFIRNNPEIKNVKEFKNKHVAFKQYGKNDLHDEIERGIRSETDINSEYGVNNIIHHPNIDETHLQHIIDGKNYDENILHHPAITKKQVMQVYDDVRPHDDWLRHKIKLHAITHPHFDINELRNLSQMGDEAEKHHIVQNPNLPEDVKQHLIKNDPNLFTGQAPTLTSDDIHNILSHPKSYRDNIGYLSSHSNFNHEHVQNFLDGKYSKEGDEHPDSDVVSEVLKKASKDQINDIIHNNPHFLPELLRNKLSKDQYHKIIDKYGDTSIMDGLYSNPNLDKTHLDKIIDKNRHDYGGMRSLLDHPNLTPEHIMKMIDTTDYHTKTPIDYISIPEHLQLPEILDKIIKAKHDNEDDDMWGWNILNHQNVSRDTLLDLLKTERGANIVNGRLNLGYLGYGNNKNITDKFDKNHYKEFFKNVTGKVPSGISSAFVNKHPEEAKQFLDSHQDVAHHLIRNNHLNDNELHDYINKHGSNEDKLDSVAGAMMKLMDNTKKLKVISQTHPSEKIRSIADTFLKHHEKTN